MTDNTLQLDDERLRRPPTIRSLTVGDTKLSYVPDGKAIFDARLLLPQTTDADWEQNAQYLDEDGNLVGGVGALLVERDGRALLIDGGLGPLTIGPPLNPIGTVSGGALLDSLATLGHSPADIEAIALTHLHPDHFGWAWQPTPDSDRPPFAGTEILVAEPEWTQRHFAEEQGIPEWIAAIARRVRTVAQGEEVFPGVRALYAPGHSAGHAAYVITVGDQRVIAFGDAFHSPLQVTHALWKNVFDHNHDQAARLRIKLLAALNEPATIGFGIHFADVPFGRVNLDSGMPMWEPVDA
jgi:glyoxylase-like metal-dependent hydrolase (beta-lactamase superfamily II)